MSNRIAELPLEIAFAQSNAETFYAKAADLRIKANEAQDDGMIEYARENKLRDELEALKEGTVQP